MEEKELRQEVVTIESQAKDVVIRTEEDLANATEFGKVVHTKIAEVKGYWKPLKDAAHKAHKEVCDRETQMLKPLMEAENKVKGAINEYIAFQREQKRKIEEEARLALQKEVEERLQRAIDAEDEEKAQIALAEAEVIEGMSTDVSVEEKKISGVVRRTDWEIVSIDPSKVPIEFGGVVIRPVDQAAVMRLIRATKGGVQIAGVEYKEVVKSGFRN